ncbi:hypothetical protein V2I21_01920 [Campylobacter sp. CLAX-22107-21]|uniref:hypothetical protein n=1 Tax=Campylobacter devanensis TaxID=3161138 RepID=UPI002EB030FA|nr:hypothetical protein [Campylobacter sp. CLAX-22107-21]
MGLDVNLYKVLTKAEITKLKNKYDVADLVYPEKDDCKELDRIYFIGINSLISCDTNFETLNSFKHCLVEREFAYYNVQAMILKSSVKTKYNDLSNYYISGFSSGKGNDYTKYEISHMKDKKDIFSVEFTYDEIKIFNHKETKLGLYLKDIEYIQRKGIKITKNLTGKCYRDNIYRLFISTESQLEKLNKNNVYKDCELKRGFKIPKNHLLYIDW